MRMLSGTMFISSVFLLLSSVSPSKADFICPQGSPVWHAENNGTNYFIYGTYGLNHGSQVSIEGWQGTQKAWVSDGTVSCSNGASICYLTVKNEREEPSIGESHIVVETIDDDRNGTPEWVVLASFGQTMWPVWGLQAEWSEGIEKAPIYPPNIYKLFDCQQSGASELAATLIPTDGKPPVWEFKEDGAYAIDDNSRSLILGETFARDNLDRFLGNSNARVIETKFEDCRYCYYVSIEDEAIILIESTDKLIIDTITAFGENFTDEYKKDNNGKFNKNENFLCEINELDGYEMCRKSMSSKLYYIINRETCAEYTPYYFPESGNYTSKGCEVIIGYELRNEYGER